MNNLLLHGMRGHTVNCMPYFRRQINKWRSNTYVSSYGGNLHDGEPLGIAENSSSWHPMQNTHSRELNNDSNDTAGNLFARRAATSLSALGHRAQNV